MTAAPRPRTGIGRANVGLAFVVVLIIGVIIVPMPAIGLDLGIAINLMLSLTVLLLALNVDKPLDFSAFPSLLQLMTILRVGLAISVARAVLLEAHGGAMVQAFGQVVVGGNPIVGVIIFVVLIAVQYLVITSGAGRVSEVTARFKLDALPGKQLAINMAAQAGASQEEIEARRANLERETDFYGAMDGASKFIKGDAIFSIVIVLVCILGGLAIGVLQNGMDIGTAVMTYAILTIGEGVVNEIGALLVSTAMGILLTRTSSRAGLGVELVGQLTSLPGLFMVVGAIACVIGFTPGFPAMIMLPTGLGLAGLGWWLSKREPVPARTIASATAAAGASAAAPGAAATAEKADADGGRLLVQPGPPPPFSVEVGWALAPSLAGSPEAFANVTARLATIRQEMLRQTGFLVPGGKLLTDDFGSLEQHSYRILIAGTEVARGQLWPMMLFAYDEDGAEVPLEGIPATRPDTGAPAAWIKPGLKDRADGMGFRTETAIQVLHTHLLMVLREHVAELLSRQEVQRMLDTLKEQAPALLEEVRSSPLTLGDIQKVLAALLHESVPIHNLVAILEACVDAARVHAARKLPYDLGDYLTEAARHALGRTICSRLRASDGKLHVLMLERAADQAMAQRLQAAYAGGREPVLTPDEARRLLGALERSTATIAALGYTDGAATPSPVPPLLVASSDMRLWLSRLVERQLPRLHGLRILSDAELAPDIAVQIHERVGIA